MAFDQFDCIVKKWGFDHDTTTDDHIKVTLNAGTEVFFDGYEVRSDFGGVRILSPALCRMNTDLTDARTVLSVHSQMGWMLKNYGTRRWQRQHKPGSKRMSAWIEQHVEYVIWPKRVRDAYLDGQLALNYPLKVMPLIDDTPAWRLPGIDGDFIDVEPFDLTNPETRALRFLIDDVTVVAAPVAQAV